MSTSCLLSLSCKRRTSIMIALFFALTASCHGEPGLMLSEPAKAPLVEVPQALPPSESAPVGFTPGSFAVDDRSGAAIYTIPLDTPPGRQGIEPDLALVYNSQAGSGLAGRRFSLSGFSAIRREPKDAAHDDSLLRRITWDDDRFSLDGQRLEVVSGRYGADGSEYYTRPFNGSKIVSIGMHGAALGPIHFIVYTRDGLTLHYGGLVDATVFDAYESPSAWLLREVIDRHGNGMEIKYRTTCVDGRTVEVLPDRILYTSHRGPAELPRRWVRFDYEARPRAGFGSFAGVRTWMTQRLRAVVTGVASDPTGAGTDGTLRTYALAYDDVEQEEGDRLVSLTERDATGAVAKKPTRFGWSGPPSFTKHENTAPELTKIHDDLELRKRAPLAVDIDLDEVTDLVYPGETDGSLVLLMSPGVTSRFRMITHHVTDIFGDPLPIETMRAVDEDHDGDQDLMLYTAWGWYLLRNLGESAPAYFADRAESLELRKQPHLTYFVDVNGDGYIDILTDEVAVRVRYGRAEGGFDAPVEPFAVYAAQSSHVLVGNCGKPAWLFLDANDDGAMDVLIPAGDGEGGLASKNLLALSFADGEMFDSGLPVGMMSTSRKCGHVVAMDVNGDGMRDVVRLFRRHERPHDGEVSIPCTAHTPELCDYEINGAAAWLNYGLGFDGGDDGLPLVCSGCTSVYFERLRVLDLDLDGADDIVAIANNASSLKTSFVRLSSHAHPDRPEEYRVSGSSALGASISESLSGVFHGVHWNPIVGDFNGDGQRDFGVLSPDGFAVASQNKEAPHVVVEIRDGRILEDDDHARSVAITYKHARGGEVCHEGRLDDWDWSVVPPIEVSGIEARCPTSMVVSSYALANDAHNPPRIYNMAYYDPRVDEYWGWLGFGQVTRTRPSKDRTELSVYDNFTRSGVASHLYPHGYYPFLGKLLRHKTRTQMEGETFETARGSTYKERLEGSVLVAYRHVQHDYTSHNGSVLTVSKETVVDVDKLGNVLERTVEQGSGGELQRQEHVLTYHPADLSHWVIGRESSHTRRWLAPDGTYAAQHETFEYYLDTPHVSVYVREPQRPEYRQHHEMTYDLYGNVTLHEVTALNALKVDETRVVSDVIYDTAEHMFATQVTDGAGLTTGYAYHPFGMVSVRVEPNEVATYFQHDGFGRQTFQKRGGLATTTTLAIEEVDGVKHVTQRVEGSDDTRQHLIFDRLGRPFIKGERTFDASMRYTRTYYTKMGRQSDVVMHLDSPTAKAVDIYSFKHDAMDRRTQIIGSDGSLIELSYADNRIIADEHVGDGTINTTEYIYDSRAELAEVRDASGSGWSYRYGVLGALATVTDPSGLVNNYLVDDWGRLRRSEEPARGVITREYDAFDDLTATLDPNGCRTTFTRDPNGRLLVREAKGLACCGAAGCVEKMTYEYDDPALNAEGRLARTTSLPWGNSTTYEYYAEGLLRHRDMLIGGDRYRDTWEYDDVGRPTAHHYPAVHTESGPLPFAVGYAYKSGQLESSYDLYDPSYTYLRTLAVDEAGRPNVFLHGNGIETTLKHESLTGRVSDIYSTTVSDRAKVIQDLHYEFMQNGQLESREDVRAKRKEKLTFDFLNRLATSTVRGTDPVKEVAATKYEYNPNGNLISRSDVGKLRYTDARHPHAVDEVQTNAGVIESYGYDANGNRTEGPVDHVAYTSFNKPKAITTAGGTVAIAYDGELQRVLKQAPSSITTYVGDFTRIQASAGDLYVYDLGNAVVQIDTKGRRNVRYLHRDYQGSPHAVTDEGGSLKDKLYFDAFGQRVTEAWAGSVTAVSKAGFTDGFTGHEHDEDIGMSLVNMGGREYDPRLGRFMSPDVTVQLPEDGQSYNGYSYALNNPFAYVDPSGYFIAELAFVYYLLFGTSGCVMNCPTGDGDLWWDEPNGAGYNSSEEDRYGESYWQDGIYSEPPPYGEGGDYEPREWDSYIGSCEASGSGVYYDEYGDRVTPNNYPTPQPQNPAPNEPLQITPEQRTIRMREEALRNWTPLSPDDEFRSHAPNHVPRGLEDYRLCRVNRERYISTFESAIANDATVNTVNAVGVGATAAITVFVTGGSAGVPILAGGGLTAGDGLLTVAAAGTGLLSGVLTSSQVEDRSSLRSRYGRVPECTQVPMQPANSFGLTYEPSKTPGTYMTEDFNFWWDFRAPSR